MKYLDKKTNKEAEKTLRMADSRFTKTVSVSRSMGKSEPIDTQAFSKKYWMCVCEIKELKFEGKQK